MASVKPYLFWNVLGAVLIVLLVLRLGPIQAMYDEATDVRIRNDQLYNAIHTLELKGKQIPRPALVKAAQEVGGEIQQSLKKVQQDVIDVDGEFWPTLAVGRADFIDFANPPRGTQFAVVMVDYERAFRGLVAKVNDSINYAHADPAQGTHLIELSPSVRGGREPEWSGGTPNLDLVIREARLFWLRHELYRVVTDPEVHVTAAHNIECMWQGQGAAPPPNEPQWFTELNWGLNLELPIERLPVLLNRLEVSRRHLKVVNVTLVALPEEIQDRRSEADPEVVAHLKYRQGRLARVVLEGTAYDFLIRPPARLLKAGDILAWPALCGALNAAGAQPLKAGQPPTVAGVIWKLLPQNVQEAVRRVAQTKPTEPPEPDEDTKALITAGLNDLLVRRDLYDALKPALEAAKLEVGAEARALIGARQVPPPAAAPLTEDEIRRMNRLLLETVFPREETAGAVNWRVVYMRLATEGGVEAVPSPCRRVWQLLPEAVRETVRRLLPETGPLDLAAHAQAKAAISNLAERLDFYREDDWRLCYLTGEVKMLVDRYRNERQAVERLNRLLLQAAFPTQIGTEYRGWPT